MKNGRGKTKRLDKQAKLAENGWGRTRGVIKAPRPHILCDLCDIAGIFGGSTTGWPFLMAGLPCLVSGRHTGNSIVIQEDFNRYSGRF